MLVEDAILVVLGFAAVFMGVPWALGRRFFFLRKKDAAWYAKQRAHDAKVKLEALKVEKEAAAIEHQYEAEVDEMIENESKESKRGL